MKRSTQLMVFALIMGAFGVAAPGFAATGFAGNCSNESSQLAMNMCTAGSFKTEDTKLNTVYKAYTAKLDAAHRTRLKTVQQTWLKFRDLDCDYESADYKGGTIYPTELNICLADVTRQRREQLEILLKDADK